MNYRKLAILAALIILVLLIPYLLQLSIPALQSLELKTLDWRFEWRGVESVEDSPIVLVTIDDYSYEALSSQWPWPRSYYARVIENLTRAGAKVIGLDVILDAPDNHQNGPQYDRELAAAIRRSERVVLAWKLEQAERTRSYQYLVEPIPILKEAAEDKLGLVSIQSDQDGIYRRYPVAQSYQERYLLSFGLEILAQYKDYDPAIGIETTKDGFRLGEIEMPLFDASSMLINFAGPRATFPYYSFASVIDDRQFDLGPDYDLNYFSDNLLPDGIFKDKIVLIGSTVSELHDNFPTPFLEYEDAPMEMPGVEIHANALRTFLNKDYFGSPPFLISLITVFLLVVLIQFACFRLSAWWSLSITALLIIVYVFSQLSLFSNFHIVMDMVAPSIAMFFSFVFTNLYQYVQTQREKKLIMGAFQQYVPTKVIQELIEHPEKLTLGGEERVMTVLFSDIAGFTTISESLKPRQLVMLLNEYLSEMTEVILKYDGIIDKYEGDAIMAEFGAPVYYADHAIKACNAALEMQNRLKQLSRKWRREGRPQLTCRAGINTGNMIVGNMGSKKVFDYTVIGDEVNLAARLEGANKPFGTHIMISESTHEIVEDYMITRPLDWIRVKGKHRPVKVYELLDRKDSNSDLRLTNILPIYSTGIRYYETRKWSEAAECFRYCLRLNPEDGPSKLYLQRVMEFSKHPPAENWDGVYELQSK